MIEYQKKKKVKRMLYSPIVLLLLAIIFVILFRSLWSVYKKEKVSDENLSKERIELEKLSLREKSLASALEYLKTEQGIESEIRSRFRLVKEGEQVAVIVDEEATDTQEQASTTNRGFWYRIFHWF